MSGNAGNSNGRGNPTDSQWNLVLDALANLSLQVASLQPGASRSSPTPATIGRQSLQLLKQYNNYVEINSELFPDRQDPFLGASDMQDLTRQRFENESGLIQWFEPHFRKLMEKVSAQLGYEVILLYSERHPWIKDPHGGADSKPDGVGIAVELASFKMTEGDRKYANDGDTKFGTLASWVLRDSLEFVSEWKVDGPFNLGVGEGLDYHRRIVSNFKRDSNVLETKNVTDLLIANRSGFLLVRCVNSDARSAYEGKWNAPGSKEALYRFALGTLWDKACRERNWKDALQYLSKKLKVKLLTPTDGRDCFLGYGSSGRVFRVQRTTEEACNTELALKVALHPDSLKAEILSASQHKEALKKADATIQILDWISKSSKGYLGLLVNPVGLPLRRLKRDVKDALLSLKRLHTAGLSHGDSRWENAIIVEAGGKRKCLWIDLRTLDSPDEEERESSFSFDVRTLFDSFHCGMQGSEVDELALAYLAEDGKLDDLLEEMKPIWEKEKSDVAGPPIPFLSRMH